MSAWIMHLRIGEKLVKKGLKVDLLPFYVGSVAPDSGTLTGNFNYEPPKSISHWHKNLPDRLESNKLFYLTYGKNEKDFYKKSFYIGYFAHILTDTFFVDGLVLPIIQANNELWKKDPWAIKGDWFNADYIFMEQNPNFEPYRMFCNTERFDNVYLDYFAKNDIFERIKGVVGFYKEKRIDRNRKYDYLPLERAEKFIDQAVDGILKIFEEFHDIPLEKL